jgi:hypothetical protein
MAIAHVSDWLGLDAFATRRALRAEMAEVSRWRRLLRSRLDLAVASYAPPEVLGTLSWGAVPHAELALPRPEDLSDLVCDSGTEDRVQLMRRIRALDKQLATYEDELERALEESTEQLVAQLAAGAAAAGPADVVG